MKTVYFVRHGEAEVNVSETFGAENSSLTEKGRDQARALAERCAKLPIDVLIASTMARAQETASFISERSGMPVVSSRLFEERKRPSWLIGKRRDDPVAEKFHEKWTATFFTKQKPVEDGDDFLSLKERAGKAILFLESRPEANILVVMHGFMLRMILARILFGDTLSTNEFYKVIRTFHPSNAGITVVDYDPSKERETVYPWGTWSVRIWNDQAHLG